jgi:hypothetical protein
MKERDLVPDVLFACMAQMDIAQLGQADRVGCYKDRPIGFKVRSVVTTYIDILCVCTAHWHRFVASYTHTFLHWSLTHTLNSIYFFIQQGLACRHCGGQPGFGRFFPNSVRSLAQTTTSQTIVKHVISKCRFTPAKVRNAIIELQHQQMARETNGRPRYGSRKIFFQRIWGKLHDGAPGKIDEYYDGGFSGAANTNHNNNSNSTKEEEEDADHNNEDDHHDTITAVPVVSKGTSNDMDDNDDDDGDEPARIAAAATAKDATAAIIVQEALSMSNTTTTNSSNDPLLLPPANDGDDDDDDDNNEFVVVSHHHHHHHKKRRMVAAPPGGNDDDDDDDDDTSASSSVVTKKKKTKIIVEAEV